MDHVFAFNGRMVVMLGVLLLLLMGLCFGLGMMYSDMRRAPVPVKAVQAAPQQDKNAVKGEKQ
ncbi:MAG: hypothetical protein ACJ8GW_11650 [Massilia sp.]